MKIAIYLFFVLSLSAFVCSCENVLFEAEPSNDPIGNFESLWNTFNERYAVFEQRGVDWNELYSQYRPMINNNTTDEELFEVLTAMLNHLDDGHVSLMAAGETFWNAHKEFRERTKVDLFNFNVIQENYMDGPMRIIDNQYAYGTINNEIGYLFVGGLSGEAPLFIDNFIAEMKDMKGIIIDLRHSNGGDFTNSEVIASRFAGERMLAFSGTPKNGKGPDDFGETTDYFIEAAGEAQFLKPVIVLTNGYTISASENLTLYLRVLPQVTVIGSNTTGAMGERIEKEMPNGWVYSISGQIITAADGNSYEGPGIPPSINKENTIENISMGIDETLEFAIETIP